MDTCEDVRSDLLGKIKADTVVAIRDRVFRLELTFSQRMQGPWKEPFRNADYCEYGSEKMSRDRGDRTERLWVPVQE